MEKLIGFKVLLNIKNVDYVAFEGDIDIVGDWGNIDEFLETFKQANEDVGITEIEVHNGVDYVMISRNDFINAVYCAKPIYEGN